MTAHHLHEWTDRVVDSRNGPANNINNLICWPLVYVQESIELAPHIENH